MLSIQIRITGSRELKQKLTRLSSSLYDLRGAMDQVGAETARYYSNQGFNSQGGVFGAAWSPLARRTIVQKSRKYPGRSPLVRTGKMRDSFTYTASSRSVLVGNKMDYFKYHQSTLPRKKIPRRQMMGVNAPVKKIVQDIITAEIKRKIRAA
jgi:phage gpG-like protein